MVKSDAQNVDEYIDELTNDRKKVIVKMRELTKQTLPKFQESMRFGMPTYDGDGKVFAFASQKNYISVYVNDQDVVLKHKKELGKVNLGKNCIRYRQPDDIDFEALRKTIAEAYC